MIILGLTGSIGMGKSTTADFFAENGAMIWNADEAVHRLYAKGGAAVDMIAEAFPTAVVDDAVDRHLLAAALGQDPEAFGTLEMIVHPLVGMDRANALAMAREDGTKLTVLDIPLLFETGGDAHVDAVVVVSAPADIQAQRVLKRPGMTQERLDAILSRQLSDGEKRQRADFIINTGEGLERARQQVEAVVKTVLDPAWTSPRRMGQ